MSNPFIDINADFIISGNVDNVDSKLPIDVPILEKSKLSAAVCKLDNCCIIACIGLLNFSSPISTALKI